MKRIILLAAAAALLGSCGKTPAVKDPIDVTFPEPTSQITKVELSDAEKGYVTAGNGMAFRFLKKMYADEDLVLSPLSLQFALAMTANGADGETLQEMIDFLGYGADGIEALNAYCKKMLEQLPAVDLDVTLKLTDAILVNQEDPLLPDFRKTVQDNYYAAVESMDFSAPASIAARINDWASRSTNGFIDKVMDVSDISADAVAYLMNALYFKALWAGSKNNPMFREYATETEDFTRSDGSVTQVPFMNATLYHRYAQMDGFRVLALPYAGGKYCMYILLPDKNDLEGLVNRLPDLSWSDILASLQNGYQVKVKLPKFDIENRFDLSETLQALGVKRAFQEGRAQFDRMFQPRPDTYYWISKVIQKARISVAEWGTEAAAVTVVAMEKNSDFFDYEPKRVNFYADHPFLYFIGEATSGTILFEGAYSSRTGNVK